MLYLHIKNKLKFKQFKEELSGLDDFYPKYVFGYHNVDGVHSIFGFDLMKYRVAYRKNESGEFVVKSIKDIKDIHIKRLYDAYDYNLIEIEYLDGSNYSCPTSKKRWKMAELEEAVNRIKGFIDRAKLD